MGSDRSSQSESRPDGSRADLRPWVALVGKRFPKAAMVEAAPDTQGLAELAEQARDAAHESARYAAGAARAASLADLAVDRLGTAPIEQARATVREIAGSAQLAAASSVEARDQAALVGHAIQCEVAKEGTSEGRFVAVQGRTALDPRKE